MSADPSRAGAAALGKSVPAIATSRRISASGVLFAAYLLSMPVYCLVRLSPRADLVWPATLITLLLWFACALAHALEHVRPPRTLMMLASGFGIALLFEHLGSSTGFLFGEYDYSDLLGPKVFGQVPALIPAAWFMMLYPSWEIARSLSARIADRLSRPEARALLRIAIAACAMTAWDLSLDPRMVADGAWIWPNGGAYFGIPLSNFAGWLVTSALIFATWTLIDRRRPSPALQQARLPQWIYIATWLGESMANALFWSGPLVGAIVFVAMGLFAAPALLLMRRT
jgi:uncharacterized membrane protein